VVDALRWAFLQRSHQQLPTGKVVVIAVNRDLRKSLAFALQADGYVVTSFATMIEASQAKGFDCVVLDHRVTKTADRDAVLDFCTSAPPIVLLAGTPQHWLLSRVASIVETPHLGAALTAAVGAAIPRVTAPAL
jgi:FixJ family two-component response regulator